MELDLMLFMGAIILLILFVVASVVVITASSCSFEFDENNEEGF